MSIVDYACLLQDERPDLCWLDALQRANFSLTGRTRIHPGLPKTRELADKLKTSKLSQVAKTREPQRREPVPEHIRLNQARIAAAETERKKSGGTLPTVTFVRGGTMIKK